MFKSNKQRSHVIRAWYIAWPIMLANASTPLLGLVDSAILGHYPNSSLLAGVALGATVLSLVAWGNNFLSMGHSGFASRLYGEKNWTGLWLSLQRYILFSILLATIYLLTAPVWQSLFLQFLGGGPKVHSEALTYIHYRNIAIPAMLLNLSFAGWYIGQGKTRVNLLALLAAQFFNLLLNLYLAWYLNMGVKGVAIASATAEYCTLLVFVLASIKSPLFKHFVLLKQVTFSEFRTIFNVSRILVIRTFALLASFAWFNHRGALNGSNILAINAVLLNFLTIISASLDGFAHAAEALVGQAIGAKNTIKLKATLITTGLLSALLSIILMTLFALLGDSLIYLLTDIEDLQVLGMEYLPWLVILPLASSASYWLDGVFVALQWHKIMRNVIVFSLLVIFIPLTYLLEGYANHGLWLAFITFMAVRSALMLAFLFKKMQSILT